VKYSTLCITTAMVLSNAPLKAEMLKNPSFESGWEGWTDVDPSAISDDAQDGVKSAKVTGSGGRFEQTIELHPNSEYQLVAYVQGAGAVGVVLGEERLATELPGDDDNWVKVSLPFSSGSHEQATIFGEYVSDDGRFDAFSVLAVNGPALEAAKSGIDDSREDEPKTYATLPDACEELSQLRIASAEDDGTSEDTHTPAMAIDSDFDPESRWSSKLPGKTLVLDMQRPQTLKEMGIAWYSGNERSSSFEIATSLDNEDYKTVVEQRDSGGETTAIERYDFDDVEARYIRVTGFGNQENEWNSIVEVQAYGCGDAEIAATGDGSDTAEERGIGLYGLKTNVPPSENFDLTDWKLTLPVDNDKDGQADEIKEIDLASGWSNLDFFYTDPVTGGMVFRSYFSEGGTTKGSRHPRSELREMLRAGDESIGTRNDDQTPNKNNWVFSSAPKSAQEAAGAVDGVLKATLAVNRVSREANGQQVGRVVIGQIHASDDEPIRLYYRKLPENKYGSIYYAHTAYGDQDEVYVEIIGERGRNAENPENGIALDEIFSYEITVGGEKVDDVLHPILNVKIIRDDGSIVEAPPFDMVDSGFSIENDFMYFKAGAYSQSITKSVRPERDFDMVTFFALDNIHD